ncbi:hypothetical protein PHYSODRAFT_339346 [Phytophthora sojae]|uniref:M96 mating-specific protein family n=1 Tax=Phytophthora sojae (strain P6497) TaxID=1094619 RepID=G5A6I4_PHYSP|nr:hypothetical protein PHYSODRAFT_339346 [Phytophthora sojae]EGZ08939.1 hypothetical protein PHYSODRAFT_339346 [Phytophthora sojae]|eukprot:XP_009535572.1 hypothetical protein PHYSODRAFT_339346 [Phytophthora sojae]
MTSPPRMDECAGVLESFLHDMEALDHLQQMPDQRRAPEPASKPAKRAAAGSKKRRTNPTWLKRKHELQALQEHAAAMETRVLYLQMKRASSMDESAARTGALVEKKRRQDVQQENERLREHLKVSVAQAKALLAATEDSRQRQLVYPSVSATQEHRLQLTSDSDVFQLLQTRVDARFYELEESFARMEQPMTSIDTDVVETSVLGSVELARLQLLPFPNADMFSAFWTIIERGSFPDGEDSVLTRLSNDVYGVKSRVTVQLASGGTIDLCSSSVLKRFATSKGVVVMTESNSNWTADHPNTGKWSHSTHEGGCFAMRDYPVECGASSGICQARSVLRLRPVLPDCDPLEAPQRVNEVVIPSFRELVNSRHQFVENALFDIIRSRTQSS